MQILCNVLWDHVDEPIDSTSSPWPQEASIEPSPSRMERLDFLDLLSIKFNTSDEVGLELINAKTNWAIHPGEYHWLEGPNLLRLQLDGLKPCFVPPRRRTTTHLSARVEEACANLDPWADGEAAASGPAPQPPPEPAEDPSDDDSVLSGLHGPIETEDVDLGGIGSDYGGSVSDPGSADPVEHCGPHLEGDVDVEALVAVEEIVDKPKPNGGGEAPPPDPPREPEAPPRLVPDPPARREPPDYPRAGRNDNQRLIQDRVVTILRSRGGFVGYSVRCPTCGVDKDLTWVHSGMTEKEALFRLFTWMGHCRENHRSWGGRLLKYCALP